MLGSPSAPVGSRRLAGLLVGFGLSGYLLLAVSASAGAGAGGRALAAPGWAHARSVAVAMQTGPPPSFDPGRTTSDLLEGPVAWSGHGAHHLDGAERRLASLRQLPPPTRLRTPMLPAGFVPNHSNAPPLAG